MPPRASGEGVTAATGGRSTSHAVDGGGGGRPGELTFLDRPFSLLPTDLQPMKLHFVEWLFLSADHIRLD